MGKRYDAASGAVVAEGIFVADVSYSAGVPTALWTERCLVQPKLDHPGETPYSLISWASDNLRVAYSTEKYVTAADGSIQRQDSVYVAYLPLSTSSDSPYDRKVQFADGDRSVQMNPTFSPVAYSDQLAVARHRDSGSANQSNDIWTVAVPFGYDAAVNGPLLPVQITRSGNTQTTYELMNIEWSPDAQWLAFDAMPLSISAARQIYKIRADGSGKSATLTNSKKQGYILTGWRP